ncbi:hypothetical protein ACSFBI_04935 [Variovorax sp. RB3P1]|uniref:hypothetical protein n=1 Tax=Variovorax sp. RB3P1 TaxID=3443732 RepID=UPI003F48A933
MARRKKGQRRSIEKFQSGSIVENLPSTSFGAEIGTPLGKSTKGQLAITYEQAACSCGGENEKCFRCDGTGFYTKQVVPTSANSPSSVHSNLRLKNQPPTESSFSNDARGGDYGIRERGRYGSNPLYDDHE